MVQCITLLHCFTVINLLKRKQSNLNLYSIQIILELTMLYTGQYVRYILTMLIKTPPALRTALTLCDILYKMLETFLREIGPHWHQSRFLIF